MLQYLSMMEDWLSRYDGHRPALDRHRKERQQVVGLIEKLSKEVLALGSLIRCLTNADARVTDMSKALAESTIQQLGLHPATARVARLHEETLLSYSQGEVHMAGFLMKRGAGAAIGGKLSNTKYKNRWFSLEGTVLKYYKEQVGETLDSASWGRATEKGAESTYVAPHPIAKKEAKPKKAKTKGIFGFGKKEKKLGPGGVLVKEEEEVFSEDARSGKELGCIDLRVCSLRRGRSATRAMPNDASPNDASPNDASGADESVALAFELVSPQRVWSFTAEDQFKLQRCGAQITPAITVAAQAAYFVPPLCSATLFLSNLCAVESACCRICVLLCFAHPLPVVIPF
jgi:hypothetical protein